MKNQVTAVPADNLIIIDGQALRFDFVADPNIHAIQWLNGKGHIEFVEAANKDISGPKNYKVEVAPFVTLWEKEKARLLAEATKPPTQAELSAQRLEEIDRQLKELDSSAGRALLELADPSTPPEDRVYSESKVAEINKAKQLLRAERTALETAP